MWLAYVVFKYLAKSLAKQQEDNCECQHLFLPDVRITGIWAAVPYSLARIRSSRAKTLSQNSEIVQKALG